MSLTNAMQTANNGLNAHTVAMNTISDNISNVSTPGFKQSRAGFQDMVAGAAGSLTYGGSGQGAQVGSITPTFTQGSNFNTGVATNLAIQGDGFFVVAGNYSGQSGQYFTRDGTFGTNSDGQLVTTDGLQVQGYAVDQTGNPIGSLIGVNLPISELSPPSATANMSLAGNINNSGAIMAFNAATPDSTCTWETGMTIYDSLGGAHSVRTYFTKSNPATVGGVNYQNVFTYNIMANPTELATGQANPITSGTLYFDDDGRLAVINNPGNATAATTVNFVSAQPNQAITINFGDPTTANSGTGEKGLTCWDGGNFPQAESQDGYGMGVLRSISVTQQGLISGAYSNGPVRPLAQVATASFPCNDQLDRIGHNLYQATFASGIPIVNLSGASISSGALEQSNVDLGEQLIRMVTNERGFQAISRTVQTANQMYSELIRLGG